MIDKENKIGFDRFLALEWADYALELFLSGQDELANYGYLKEYLKREIKVVETARKTANQLKRLWLNNPFLSLRVKTKENFQKENIVNNSLYHFGMAINVFPVFYTTCQKMGELSAIQDQFDTRMIIDRVARDFVSPNSIPRVVTRVIQTLIDWGFVSTHDSILTANKVAVTNTLTSLWLIDALFSTEKIDEITLSNLVTLPVKIGIDLGDIRKILAQSAPHTIRRNGAEEFIIDKRIT